MKYAILETSQYSSSICSFEEDSIGTSSCRTVSVHTEWRQLLYAHVILFGATNTLSNDENSSSGRKVLHRVTRTGNKYLDPGVL